MKRPYKLFVLFVAAGLVLSGCNFYNLVKPQPTPVPPTPTPLPPIELNICLGYEPRSLYLNKAGSDAEREVLQALYGWPVNTLGNEEEGNLILEEIPNFDDGSAFFTTISISEGDEVVNSYGDLVAFKPGTPIFPAGCTSSDCVNTWDGISEIAVNQMKVIYKLRSGLSWSDGQPLTATDSLYAFELAADPATPVSKKKADLTDTYVAVDDVTIEWVGKPGLVTHNVSKFFWAPMPKHAWEKYSVDEILTVDEVNQNPLSWGPFMVEEWLPGNYIRLVRNPHYYRSDEGLPLIDIVTYKFLQNTDPESLLIAAESECDIVSPTAINLDDVIYLSENAVNAGFLLKNLLSEEIELLAFGITPYSYDDYYYPYGVDRPDIFGDVLTRQAIAHCIDRDTIVNKLIGSAVKSADLYLDSDHKLLENLSITTYPYDPTEGTLLLEQVGWKDPDLNPETPITAVSVLDVPPGTEFEVDLYISESSLRSEIASLVVENLTNCGIKANISQVSLNELYQPGPEGTIFGRQFDLAILSWETGGDFACELFTTVEIPTDENYWLGEKTGGANFYGYSNTSYDETCAIIQQQGLDEAVPDKEVQDALSLLNMEIPFFPLYHHPNMIMISNQLSGTGDFRTVEDLYSNITSFKID